MGTCCGAFNYSLDLIYHDKCSSWCFKQKNNNWQEWGKKKAIWRSYFFSFGPPSLTDKVSINQTCLDSFRRGMISSPITVTTAKLKWFNFKMPRRMSTARYIPQRTQFNFVKRKGVFGKKKRWPALATKPQACFGYFLASSCLNSKENRHGQRRNKRLLANANMQMTANTVKPWMLFGEEKIVNNEDAPLSK